MAVALAAVFLACTDGAVQVNNSPPRATIELPAVGASVEVGTAVQFRGLASDGATPAEELRVVWTSSMAGELFTGGVDADGVSAFEDSSLEVGEHLITFQVTDAFGTSGTDSRTLVIVEAVAPNVPPTAPGVSIDPSEPTSGDELRAVLVPAEDTDGPEALTYRYAWSRGGVPQPEWDGEAVPATATANGDEWTVSVVAFDGEDEGPPGEATVTVGCTPGSGEAEDCPAASCLELLEAGHSVGDGDYWLDPNGTVAARYACNMTRDGGGWTGVEFASADALLGGTLTAVDAAATEGVDAADGPFTRDADGDVHTYHYTFDFQPRYSAFYLLEWQIKGNAAPGFEADISPVFGMSTWDQGYRCDGAPGCGWGDVGFGSPSAPVTSYGATLSTEIRCDACVENFPGGDAVHAVGDSGAFRVGWGEGGVESEGWYPWWGGRVFLR